MHDIVRYIANDKPGAARQVIEAIINTCEALQVMPEMGRIIENVRDREMFMLPIHRYTNYLVFYDRPSESTVRILHIIDGRRDLPTLFESWNDMQ